MNPQEMNQQIRAQIEYKNLKGTSDPINTYEGAYNSKHFTNVPNGAIQQTPPPAPIEESPDKTNFVKASKEFWTKNDPGGMNKYCTGEMIANMIDKRQSLDILFDRLYSLIKDCIGSELSRNNVPNDQYKEYFKVLESAFKLLSAELIKNKAPVEVKNVVAMIQGFINGYIEKTKQN